ncbi:hypothetical protein PLEOSDRAFT_167309 [Pleurotus ostreatus PC15]|uniref:Uncharacterized protein n=1 Tax=Pleurotus ostreatus (strain PC15) TaxID=1137138 RepID=A0A067P0H1_PLEO1|nr:hypothetical protein PLEOSDRAFT_167309 [Pleurotus ostreatus PC15]
MALFKAAAFLPLTSPSPDALNLSTFQPSFHSPPTRSPSTTNPEFHSNVPNIDSESVTSSCSTMRPARSALPPFYSSNDNSTSQLNGHTWNSGGTVGVGGRMWTQRISI